MAPCTAIWQQPLQSAVDLGCSATDTMLWTITLDKSTRADLSESVVSERQGFHVRQHGTEHTPSPRIGIKIPDSAGLAGRDSTDHATATDQVISLCSKSSI